MTNTSTATPDQLEEDQSTPEMEEENTDAADTAADTSETTATAGEEKKPEGIEHDPYEWGKCALTASIVWLPDGSVMLGVRNHLDAPIITVLSGEALTRLPGHAAELPLPTLETLADLLAQLREDLPLRARAKAEREEAARKKAEEASARRQSAKKDAKVVAAQKDPAPAKPNAVGKIPSATQASLFNLMTGEK
jgi:hypothetical protein